MPVRVKITMSPEEYLRHMKEVEAATVKTANTMEDKFRNVGTSINKAGIATRFVSSEMGALGVAIGRVFQVAGGGKLAIAVAAIAAAFTGLKKVTDATTISSDEYNQSLDEKIKLGEKELQQLKQQQSEEDGYMERLQELNEREDKTNEEKEESMRLAQILVERYGDLGISVKDLTGDFSDLTAALKKMDEAQKAQRLEAIAQQIANLQSKSDALAKTKIGGNWASDVWEFFGGTSELAKSNRQEYLRKDTAGKLAYANEMVNGGAKTEESIRFWAEQAETLTKIQDLEKQMLNLRVKGVETDKEETEVLKRNSEESRKAKEAQEEADRAAADELDKYAKEQEEIDRKHGEALQRQLEQEKKITDGIKQRRFDQIANLKLSAMRATGRTEEAAVRSAWYDESKAQGKPLDDTTKRQIAEMTRAQLALDNAMNTASTAPMDYAPRVNSLIARGGSAQAVKMPSLEDIQKRTLNQLEDITKIVRYINDHVGDWGKVTNV